MKHSVLAWLQACEEDLSAAESLLQSKVAAGAASFHAQQCVEKCLKAVLEQYTKTVPKIHDLDKLFYEAQKYINIETDEIIVNKLNMLYIKSRYPGAFGFLPDGKPSMEEVESFYNFANNIYDMVKIHLKDQVIGK
ncbi:HEPN domain-containing protein [Desulfonema limicola]|uniref:HEPN domain-containing protein n=1 Tax=Desulfonema limicola TaxID=45656 RepID=A0A975B7H8_9BACT|nr:HEPN domain-containing protein [Desulfonema limicola]QTA80226.1 HEPN domain-containing protein [Desulfonema limicola]